MFFYILTYLEMYELLVMYKNVLFLDKLWLLFTNKYVVIARFSLRCVIIISIHKKKILLLSLFFINKYIITVIDIYK